MPACRGHDERLASRGEGASVSGRVNPFSTSGHDGEPLASNVHRKGFGKPYGFGCRAPGADNGHHRLCRHRSTEV